MAEKKTDSKAKTTKAATAAKKTVAKKTTTAKKAAAKKAAATAVAPKSKATAASKARAKAKAAHPVPVTVPGRKERRGVVVSAAMDKTVVVRIDTVRAHDRYGRVVRRSRKLHVHDEDNTAGIGDVVRVVETRPLSATKHWRLLEILEKAK